MACPRPALPAAFPVRREPSCWGNGGALQAKRVRARRLPASRPWLQGSRAHLVVSPPFPLVPGFTVDSVVSFPPPSASAVPALQLRAVYGAGLSLPQSQCGASAALILLGPPHPFLQRSWNLMNSRAMEVNRSRAP